MFGLGLPELAIVLVIVILIFGASRLGDIGSGLGKAMVNHCPAWKRYASGRLKRNETMSATRGTFSTSVEP